MCCLKSLLGELTESCVTLLGDDPWTWKLVFTWTSPHVPFLFDDFALHPFAVIIHSCKYYYMLGPMSSAGESLNLGVDLGTYLTWLVFEVGFRTIT